MNPRTRRYTKYFLIVLSGMIVSCLAIAVAGFVSNQNLPTEPENTSQIATVDKIRLAETIYLREQLGDEIWPGWGQVDIPLILWNADYEFLAGVSEPPAGWDVVPGDSFQGEAYFRRPADDPQNFAMPIGDQWAASMATKYETDRFIQEVFVDVLPPIIEDVFPYRLLIQPSEVQISGMLHESFHVLQVEAVPETFAAAEETYTDEEKYFLADQEMHAAWETEIDLLISALRANDASDAAEYARQFLAQRDQRREDNNLSLDLVDYERFQEWLEGSAKYVELGIWEAATETQKYTPLPETSNDPDFKGYRTFKAHFRRELDQAKRQASQDSVVRFYYTGMLQGRILDRLLPGWKTRALEEGVFLEDLLRDAVSQ